jgi:hypothetical protein
VFSRRLLGWAQLDLGKAQLHQMRSLNENLTKRNEKLFDKVKQNRLSGVLPLRSSGKVVVMEWESVVFD